MTLTVKNVYNVSAFHYPKWLTATHFISGFIVCSAVMLYRRLVDGKGIPVPTTRQFFSGILPIAISFSASIGASNMALVGSNAAFVEMVSASGPLCTVLASVAMGLPFKFHKVWPVILVTVGMCVCATGELKFSMLGFCLALFATLARAVKASLQQLLMSNMDNQVKLDPIELLAWVCPPSILIMLTWSWLTEGSQPYWALAESDPSLRLHGSILLTCFNACVLNVSALFVMKDLGAVAMQLCGQLKGAIVVIGGVAIFGEHVTSVQTLGFALEMIGAFWYNSLDQRRTPDDSHEEKVLGEADKCTESAKVGKYDS